MSRREKTRELIMDPNRHGNVRFDELCSFLESVGFSRRNKASSHVIFTKKGIEHIINLQEGPGGAAKRWQVRQVMEIITSYKL